MASPLYVGSVKANIGHLEPAAGAAALIKTVLMLQHGEVPPQIHAQDPTRFVDWQTLPLRIAASATAWNAARRVAGISSFALSGTSAHMVVAEPPSEDEHTARPERREQVFATSAKTPAALRALAERYAGHIVAHPDESLADLCFTVNTCRLHRQARLAICCSTRAELRDALESFSQAGDDPRVFSTGRTGAAIEAVAFRFGDGGHRVNVEMQYEPIILTAIREFRSHTTELLRV